MRLYDWEARFAAYIVGIARTPFRPGALDCALFAAGGAQAVTGIDPAAAFRGRYRTIEAGLKLMRAGGHEDHVAFAQAHFPAVGRAQALPADIAVVTDAGFSRSGPALGLVQGEMIYVLRGAGLGLVPIEAAGQILGVR